jgi:hypothetical protein
LCESVQRKEGQASMVSLRGSAWALPFFAGWHCVACTLQLDSVKTIFGGDARHLQFYCLRRDSVKVALLALGDGDSVSLSGAMTIGIYEARDGTTRINVNLAAHRTWRKRVMFRIANVDFCGKSEIFVKNNPFAVGFPDYGRKTAIRLHIPGEANQTPFAAHLLQTAHRELAKAHHRLNDAEDGV